MDASKRVVIVGCSCSGKTHLSSALAKRLNAIHIEIDALHWKPNWIERETHELRKMVYEAIQQDRWVCDGNYSKLRDVVWPHADALIWLNYPFYIVFYRAIRRTLRRVFQKTELYAGNRETFQKAFLSRDSILLWVLTSYWSVRKKYRKIFDEDQYPHLVKVEFKKPAEAEEYMEHNELI